MLLHQSATSLQAAKQTLTDIIVLPFCGFPEFIRVGTMDMGYLFIVPTSYRTYLPSAYLVVNLSPRGDSFSSQGWRDAYCCQV